MSNTHGARLHRLVTELFEASAGHGRRHELLGILLNLSVRDNLSVVATARDDGPWNMQDGAAEHITEHASRPSRTSSSLSTSVPFTPTALMPFTLQNASSSLSKQEASDEPQRKKRRSGDVFDSVGIYVLQAYSTVHQPPCEVKEAYIKLCSSGWTLW